VAGVRVLLVVWVARVWVWGVGGGVLLGGGVGLERNSLVWCGGTGGWFYAGGI